jgi:ATP/maltotriose-dependent transcriptional regulator MalT
LGAAEGELAWAAFHQAAGDLVSAYQRAAAAMERASQPRQPLSLLAAHRLLGELDMQSGRLVDAMAHLEQAARLAVACRAPFERALVERARAELALYQGDLDVARPLLDAARETFTRLDARPSLARVHALAVQLGRE